MLRVSVKEVSTEPKNWEVKITLDDSREEDIIHLWKTRWPSVVRLYNYD